MEVLTLEDSDEELPEDDAFADAAAAAAWDS